MMMIHIYVCLESLYPETTADKARAANAKKAMLIAAAVASVKVLTTADLMRFVMGTAADSADISKYATTCKCIHRSQLAKTYIIKHCNQLHLKKIMVTNSFHKKNCLERTKSDLSKERKW
jgi:hypothetical protein